MPALEVDDRTALPRLGAPGLGDTVRAVRQVTSAPKGYEGEGFPVHRAFAGVELADLDPFVHLDQMGAVEYAAGEPKGTPWHPHRGFETVTYMIDGVFDHHDSHGGGGSITNGDTQWMTAGSGLLHIETPPEWLVEQGGLFHGIQLWVNLPRAQKMTTPNYQDLRSAATGLATSADGGALVRVIAGDVGPVSGPGSTRTPITLVHASVPAGARLDIPWPASFNGLVYVLSGNGFVGDERVPIGPSQLAVLGSGDFVSVSGGAQQDTRTPSLEVVVLGGEPIREPIAWAGPFVMNTRQEVLAAYEDYSKGRLGVIPAG